MSLGTLLKHSVHNSCADAVVKIPKNQENITTKNSLFILIVPLLKLLISYALTYKDFLPAYITFFIYFNFAKVKFLFILKVICMLNFTF